MSDWSHALAACLTIGIGNIAAARGIALTEVESTAEGDIDLLGLLGPSEKVRNGYAADPGGVRIKGDAHEATLKQPIARSTMRSAVYDVVTNSVPVDIQVSTHRREGGTWSGSSEQH